MRVAPAFLCRYSGRVFGMLEVFIRISTESENLSTDWADLSTKRGVSCVAGTAGRWSTHVIDSDRSGPPGPGIAGKEGSRGDGPQGPATGRAARNRPERAGSPGQAECQDPQGHPAASPSTPERLMRPQGHRPGSRDYSRPFRVRWPRSPDRGAPKDRVSKPEPEATRPPASLLLVSRGRAVGASGAVRSGFRAQDAAGCTAKHAHPGVISARHSTEPLRA